MRHPPFMRAAGRGWAQKARHRLQKLEGGAAWREMWCSAGQIPMRRNIILTGILIPSPQEVKDELRILCVLYTEDIGGILLLEFDPEGTLSFKVVSDPGDYLFDEIGSALKIKQYQTEKRELLESLELYYRTFFMGSGKGPGNGGEDSGL